MLAFAGSGLGEMTIDGDDQSLGHTAEGLESPRQAGASGIIKALETMDLLVQCLQVPLDLGDQLLRHPDIAEQLGDVTILQQGEAAVE